MTALVQTFKYDLKLCKDPNKPPGKVIMILSSPIVKLVPTEVK